MIEPHKIRSREDYEMARKMGFEPLIDYRFSVDVGLRVSIQRELFGTGHTPAENDRFYRWCWEHYPHYCQECMRPLRQYSATYVSHIMTRGAHPETAHDCRNINILCFSHHSVWENGNRKNMRIYQRNMQIVEELKKDYSAI